MVVGPIPGACYHFFMITGKCLALRPVAGLASSRCALLKSATDTRASWPWISPLHQQVYLALKRVLLASIRFRPHSARFRPLSWKFFSLSAIFPPLHFNPFRVYLKCRDPLPLNKARSLTLLPLAIACRCLTPYALLCNIERVNQDGNEERTEDYID